MNDSKASQCRSQAEIVSMRQLFYLVFRRTFIWVGSGVVFMVLGIGILQATLLPKILSCPPNATCAHSYDPNTSTILQLLQTAMSWWLKIGLIIASVGLLRLSAYQSWFVMIKHGNSIDNLDLTLGAIKGSLTDACQLVLRRRNIVISLLLLGQIGIGAAIDLFIGLSIVRSPGESVVKFSYAPVSDLPYIGSKRGVIAKVEGWALTNDTAHGYALKGSLVKLDGRSNSSSVDAQASGPRITGSILCAGVSNENITKVTTNDREQYLIKSNGFECIAEPQMLLSVCPTSGEAFRMFYLWASNTKGVLPNATNTPDGVMYATLCMHDVLFQDSPGPVPDVQYLQPNTIVMSGCATPDMTRCVASSVSGAIAGWWEGPLNPSSYFENIMCRGGVLGPLRVLEDLGHAPPFCPLTEELWVGTVTSVLDGMMQAGPARGHDVQSLKAKVQNIDSGWWWLQGVIPLMTLLLYSFTLAYTCHLSQGNSTLKSLDLEEIITAGQTDHVWNLVQSGRLRKSVMKYDNGFTKDERQGP